VERLRTKGRWMNIELSEKDKDTDKQERRERIKVQQRVSEVYDRGDPGVPGEGEKEAEERRCRMCNEERETIEYMWNGCSEMRETERKERGEILNEDGREIRWMKEIWNRGERM
jgi:hypothetical protein